MIFLALAGGSDMSVKKHKTARRNTTDRKRNATVDREFKASSSPAANATRRKAHSKENGEIDTLAALLSRLAAFDERPAFVTLSKDDVEEWTYAKLTEQARRLANGFAQEGLGKGDHV